MEFFIYDLGNGIRGIHKQVKSPVTYCAMTINSGSRDELPDQYGLAHLTEHCLFKGTGHRRAYHINSRLEKLGGELNAFTSKEETAIQATTLRGDFSKAAGLLSDIIFNSTFPEKEVEREKEVIIDEINSYKDSPSESIYDDFEDMIFAQSQLGHNILGTKKSVSAFSRQSIMNFVQRTYNTDQMIFSSIGNMSAKAVVRIAGRCFADTIHSSRDFSRQRPVFNSPFNKTLNRSTYQGHCIMGSAIQNVTDNQRAAVALLINILGGPAANSLLNIELREKRGLSYNTESAFTNFSDSALATIYFSSDKDNFANCAEITNKVLDNIKCSCFSSMKLSMAKRQFMGQFAISADSSEGYMLGAAKSLMMYNEVDEIDSIYKKIHAVTSSDLRDTANEIFTNMSLLAYK